MLQECKFKNFDGSIWVETYEDRVEDDRCRVYDEYHNYIDYICCDELSKEEYDNIINDYLNSEDEADFIEQFWYPRYYMADDKLDLMYSVYADEYETREQDPYSQAICDELEEDYEKLTDEEFCMKYEINKVGNTYFYLGDY